MTRGRGTASIVASPVLVGAVTTLIVIVSVFLAYNANQGLPFVPTYNIKAQLPGGANLVPGNEVRIGRLGAALAGRGPDINTAIQSLAPFFRYLGPVMANLSNPATRLNQFFLQIGRASAQVAPVAAVNAQLFADMADTFAAIGANPPALQATIAKGPPTEDAAIRSF